MKNSAFDYLMLLLGVWFSVGFHNVSLLSGEKWLCLIYLFGFKFYKLNGTKLKYTFTSICASEHNNRDRCREYHDQPMHVGVDCNLLRWKNNCQMNPLLSVTMSTGQGTDRCVVNKSGVICLLFKRVSRTAVNINRNVCLTEGQTVMCGNYQ